MNSLPLPTRCFLAVEAEPDPTVAARLLHLLSVRGDIPEWFSVRRHRADLLRIAIELGDVDAAAAQALSQQIRSLPTVRDVTTAWLRPRDALVP